MCEKWNILKHRVIEEGFLIGFWKWRVWQQLTNLHWANDSGPTLCIRCTLTGRNWGPERWGAWTMCQQDHGRARTRTQDYLPPCHLKIVGRVRIQLTWAPGWAPSLPRVIQESLVSHFDFIRTARKSGAPQWLTQSKITANVPQMLAGNGDFIPRSILKYYPDFSIAPGNPKTREVQRRKKRELTGLGNLPSATCEVWWALWKAQAGPRSRVVRPGFESWLATVILDSQWLPLLWVVLFWTNVLTSQSLSYLRAGKGMLLR